jgi:hypothetical protein
MSRRGILLLVAAAVTLAIASFQAGRQTVIGHRRSSEGKGVKQRRGVALRQRPKIESEHQGRLIVANVADVPFAELYNVLESASPQTRSAWAKELEAMPWGPQRNAAISSFYKTLVQLDPHEAIELAVDMRDKDAQTVAIGRLVEAAPQSAMSEVANMLVKLPPDSVGGLRSEFLNDTINQWSMVDPVAASRFIERNSALVPPESVMYLLEHWADRDPKAAKDWLDRQNQELQTATAIRGLVTGWFDKDHSIAVDYALAHAGDEKFDPAIQDLARALFLKSPNEAHGFVEKLPTANLKRIAIGQITAIGNGGKLLGLNDWKRPPGVVANWMVMFPHEVWGGLIGPVVDVWEKQDAEGFSTWINQLPTETYDQVVTEYCLSPGAPTPERLLPLALNISDPALRADTVRNLVYQWSPDETPQKLAEMLQETELTETQKADIIKIISSNDQDGNE